MNNPICRFNAVIRSPIDGKISLNLECVVYHGWIPGWGPTIVMEFGEKSGIIELTESEAFLLLNAISEIVFGTKNITSLDTHASGPVTISTASSYVTWNEEDTCIWHAYSGHLLPYHIKPDDWRLIEVSLRKALYSSGLPARAEFSRSAQTDERLG